MENKKKLTKEIKTFDNAIDQAINLIDNDSYVIQFQTVGQYRSWLIKQLKKLKDE